MVHINIDNNESAKELRERLAKATFDTSKPLTITGVVTPAHISILQAVLSERQITHVKFDCQFANTAGVFTVESNAGNGLADLIRSNPQLQSVEFSRKARVSIQEQRHILAIVGLSTLQKFAMHCEYSYKHIQLREALHLLKNNQHLQHLTLTGLQARDTATLAKFIQTHPTLQRLGLQGLSIRCPRYSHCDSAVNAFAAQLDQKHITRTMTIDLSDIDTYVPDAGVVDDSQGSAAFYAVMPSMSYDERKYELLNAAVWQAYQNAKVCVEFTISVEDDYRYRREALLGAAQEYDKELDAIRTNLEAAGLGAEQVQQFYQKQQLLRANGNAVARKLKELDQKWQSYERSSEDADKEQQSAYFRESISIPGHDNPKYSLSGLAQQVKSRQLTQYATLSAPSAKSESSTSKASSTSTKATDSPAQLLAYSKAKQHRKQLANTYKAHLKGCLNRLTAANNGTSASQVNLRGPMMNWLNAAIQYQLSKPIEGRDSNAVDSRLTAVAHLQQVRDQLLSIPDNLTFVQECEKLITATPRGLFRKHTVIVELAEFTKLMRACVEASTKLDADSTASSEHNAPKPRANSAPSPDHKARSPSLRGG